MRFMTFTCQAATASRIDLRDIDEANRRLEPKIAGRLPREVVRVGYTRQSHTERSIMVRDDLGCR